MNKSRSTVISEINCIIVSEDEQSAILFVGDIDDTDCEILVDFIKSYTTTIFPVSYDDIIINYQLDSCKGEKGSVKKITTLHNLFYARTTAFVQRVFSDQH